MSVLPAGMSVHHMYVESIAARRGHLELELQIIVSHHVGAGNKAKVL